MNGWIKLHRKILEWGWYSDINTRVVFIHLLLLANFDDRYYLGKLIKRGDCVVALSTLAQQTSLTLTQVRTALNHLKSTHEITIRTTNKYSIVTICNFDNYQVLEIENNTQNNTQANKQITNKQQTNNTQTNNTIRINNLTIEESKEERVCNAHPNKPTLQEVIEFAKLLQLDEEDARQCFLHYDSQDWITGNGAKIRNWQSKVQSWCWKNSLKRKNDGKSKKDINDEAWKNEMYAKLAEQDRRKQLNQQ